MLQKFNIFLYIFSNILLITCQICNNPFLSQSYNSWAPVPNITVQTAQKFDSLKICSYLDNQLSCCDSNILDVFNSSWGIFKSYFTTKNKEQLKLMISQIENVYSDRMNVISRYKDVNSSLNSIYNQLDSLMNQQYSINLSNLSSFTNQFDNYDLSVSQSNIDDFLSFVNETLKIDTNQFSQIKINDYLNWESNISDYLIQNTSDYTQQNYIRYLDSLDENGLNQEINNTQIRYINLVDERTKCYSAVFRHFASLMCLACEPDFDANGIFLNNHKININLSMDACNSIQNDCYGYLESLVEMNKNALFFANSHSINDLKISTANASSVSELYNFLTNRVNSIKTFLNEQLLFVMPNNCYKDDCSWMCYNYLNAVGLDFQNIINGSLISIDSTSIFNLNLNFYNRILDNNQTFNSETINFNESFMTNTYSKADSTNLNFTIEGGAGLALFQNNTNQININSMFGKKIIIDFFSMSFLIFLVVLWFFK